MVRWKKRYFVISLTFKKKDRKPKFLAIEQVQKAVLKSVEDMYGDFGVANVLHGIQVKFYNVKSGIFYLRVNREFSHMAAASLPLVSVINDEPVTLSCLFTSGTVRHAHMFLRKYSLSNTTNQDTLKNKTEISKLKTKITERRKLRVTASVKPFKTPKNKFSK